MEKLLERLLSRIFTRGTLAVTTASGHRFTVGDQSGEAVAVRFTNWKAQAGVLFDPDLKLGEAYTEGSLVVEQGTIADLLSLALSQDLGLRRLWWMALPFAPRHLLRRRQQANGQKRSKENVSRHYDLDASLYDLFLDTDRQYSCGHFENGDEDLEEAQLAKKRHIAAKLLIGPNDRVLDIGCGWGGLALYLAKTCDARHVTGITLSEEQLKIASQRVRADALDDQVNFALSDYRNLVGTFDRIVSVGMFEHVGVDHYDTFFRKCANLLREKGVMVLHAIGRSDPPGITNPWIAKHIFPGGYIPALSEVFPAIERAGLLVTDVEILRLHYADTLRHWRTRFLERREAAARLYDERFVRLWEYYLAASEMAFRKQSMMVFQLQLAKRQDIVPRTRSYIAREEARLRHLEQGPIMANPEYPGVSYDLRTRVMERN